MKKIFVFFFMIFGFVVANADSLAELEKSADTMYFNSEINKDNYFRIKSGTNLRSKPVIRKSTLAGKSEDKVYLIKSCGKKWCQIFDSGLWVYSARLIQVK